MNPILPTTEKYLSQIPAMQALMRFGYQCLPQKEADRLRGGRHKVLLEKILIEQILKLNRFTYRGTEHQFSQSDAEEAVRKLKPSPIKQRGLVRTNQDIYDQLLLGTTIEKIIDNDKKSYSIKYIDWNNPENNVYHATVEMIVEQTSSLSTRRLDIVLFVNGIPFVVIENKSPTESVKQAVTQHIRNQKHDEIPYLFHYAQLLVATNKNETLYGTVGTSKNYWAKWKDQEDKDEDIQTKINISLDESEKAKLFSGDFANARSFFEAQSESQRAVTEQDRSLYALCRPERLLELVRLYSVFDGGTRKLARYQQFFGVKETMRRLSSIDYEGKRNGGVIWHTQGSGKSLTMVMLAKALALSPYIINPRIVIATDREDLDLQIMNTFKSCEMESVRSTSGTNLVELLQQKKSLITTIINKFDSAMRTRDFIDNDSNLFVLVDESHRTQYGSFAAKMRRILPKACYIGFTGTPLLKAEKSTLNLFGGLIHKYTIDDAVRDGAVVPLLYEGRYIDKRLSGTAIDEWFDRLAKGLTDQQKTDLKKKFSKMAKLSKAKQSIYAKAIDISEHFRQTWQGTGLKAQLVAPSKAAAIQFKDILDEIGHITSDVIISPPDDRESNDMVDMTSRNRIQTFWDDMMKKYGSEVEYNRQITESFKNAGDPEILIVVSKLLTGFDAPRNTVLYVCKSLKEHNLLQAVARVNRLCEEEEDKPKQFGYIIDYEGLLGDLDEALTTYSTFDGYDAEDLKGAITDIRQELKRLPPLHQNIWNVFKEVSNKLDHEQMEQHLADQELREDFYSKLREFGSCLHITLSSEKAYDVYTTDQLEKFKSHWKQFSNLRRSVQIRYQEIVDIKEYEPKIQKLLDDHIIATPAKVIIEEFNINDPAALEKVLAENEITEASKADRIASATKKTIKERMEEDPAFYKSFSQMLEDTIQAYRTKRISEIDYLKKATEIANDVAKGKRDQGIPTNILNNSDAQAFYGEILPFMSEGTQKKEEVLNYSAQIAIDIVEIIKGKEHFIVHLWQNLDAQNRLKTAIDDYFFDVVAPKIGILLDVGKLDMLEESIMSIAKARFPL